MKKIHFFLLLLLPLLSQGQHHFDDYFERKSLRFDFIFASCDQEVKVYPVQMKEKLLWAGSLTNLIDTFHYGTYQARITDVKNGQLIFSSGFNTLFQEWQTTKEAKIQDKAFYQSLIFPFPKKMVRLEIDYRQWNGYFKTIYQTEIDPHDYFILKESPPEYETAVLQKYGLPEEKVDLVILPEGYQLEEMNKFLIDAKRMLDFLFDEKPFRSAKEKFNVHAVLVPSLNSGTDLPGEEIYRNTALNSTFYTFDLDRYLTTSDMKAIHDVAASVPYDHIFILVNSDRYGGGGIYNFLNICTSDHPLSPKVFVHEFGHGFAGLGDEYYSSAVAYEGFYNLETEPWEPNLTTLKDFKSKWAAMVHDSVPVPTPREQKYLNTVGVYEGGGYQSKGIYSPYIHCRMKSNEADGFCPVCVDAIQRRIEFYCH